jgi:hypothetical protein
VGGEFFYLELFTFILLMVTAFFANRIVRFQRKMANEWHTLRTTSVKNPIGNLEGRRKIYLVMTIVMLIAYMVLRGLGQYQYAVLALIFAYFTYSSIFMMMRQTTEIRMNREGIYLPDRMVTWDKIEYYEWKKDKRRPSGVVRLKIKGKFSKVGFMMDTQSRKNVAKFFERNNVEARGETL